MNPRGSFQAKEATDGTLKLVTRVTPQYPALARTMSIRGSVKVEAVIALNGTPKPVDIKGGHPVLAQAAQIAVRQWKWEPAPHETTELIEINFNPWHQDGIWQQQCALPHGCHSRSCL